MLRLLAAVPFLAGAAAIEDYSALVQNALAPSLAAAEEWRLKRTPEPTEPPRDPLEVKLGRALTPPEYRQWLKEHTQPAGPQKRINKPHVMSPEGYKKYLENFRMRPTEAPSKELKNRTVVFAKKTAEMMASAKANVGAALDRYKEEAARQAEEHKAWAEEQRAEAERRKTLEQKAANKVKERKEWMKNAAEQRQAKILAKEQKEEDYLKAEEDKIQLEIAVQKESVMQEKQQAKAMNAAKHWAEFHFVKAAVGEDCPKGWTPVLTPNACKLAQKVLGGVDETDVHVARPNRPGGCYWHTTSGHVAFNSEIGQLSDQDERICEKKRAASRGELEKLYKKVIASEIEREAANEPSSDSPNFDLEAAKAIE